ncbi:MAG: hypothetical protein ACTSPM_02260 [Candidatus Heimdallarchaeota archaeon]
MRKTILISSFLTLIMIISVALITTQAQSGFASAPESDLFTQDDIGDPMGDKGIWAVDASTNTILADGDLDDWEGLAFENFNGINVSLAFDATNVYIALQWEDTTNSIEVGQWNKTGLINPSLVDWSFVDGADDVVQIGFTDGVDTDIMIWTASNRTNAALAFECDNEGIADAGALPYAMNTNETDTFVNAKPTVSSDWVPIANEFVLANGTLYDAWQDDDSANIAGGGQLNTAVGADFNSTLENCYTIEMIRLLDTTDPDDFVLDFTGALSFKVGVANQDSTIDMLIQSESLKISTTNEAAGLTFTEIIANPVSETLIITGEVFDDYEGYSLIVEMDGWDYTYGAGSFMPADVNEATGAYSFLFTFDRWDMPLGEQTIFVSLYTLYEAPIVLNQTIEIDDINAPYIEGIVDLQDRYPAGVPLDEDYVVVTVGLGDNYAHVNDITAFLYSYRDDHVALKTDMVQFASGSTTFVANITIDHGYGVVHNYTYFVQAWDTNFNKVTSEYFSFLVVGRNAPPIDTTQNSVIVPLPTLEIALAAIVLIAIISKARQKKIIKS